LYPARREGQSQQALELISEHDLTSARVNAHTNSHHKDEEKEEEVEEEEEEEEEEEL
jgi:hypothetical protein